MKNQLIFDDKAYETESLEVNGQTLVYRAFRPVCYVEKAEDEVQHLRIYVPEAYYQGKEINGYQRKTAPIFLPNTVGGYCAGPLAGPEIDAGGKVNTIARALLHGYVTVSAGVRGRNSVDDSGYYLGAAPAVVCDMKAAVRYLRYNRERIPGNTDRIITNGTSAGGALSALMGATGDHPDYEPYLQEMGAAPASDRIFAASCYCPITNLDHADMAYEWEFHAQKEYHGWKGSGTLTEKQEKLSKELAAAFPTYLNNLQLRREDGSRLTLEEDGTGSFLDQVKHFVTASAQKELNQGHSLSAFSWLTVEDGRATDVDFPAYISYRTRMKKTPAFDNVSMGTPENELFGTRQIRERHFTQFSFDHSEGSGGLAESSQVKMMNPMNYIGDEKAAKAAHFRIRHGSIDRDTSLVIPVMLHTRLLNEGIDSQLEFPWGIPHSGDYDLEELFVWIDRIVSEKED